jgi:hypothetical protein
MRPAALEYARTYPSQYLGHRPLPPVDREPYAHNILMTPGLEAYWRMNDRDLGTLMRDSRRRFHDGIYSSTNTTAGPALIASDESAGSFQLGPGNNYAYANSWAEVNVPGDATVEFWARLDDITGWRTIIHHNSNTALIVTQIEGQLCLAVREEPLTVLIASTNRIQAGEVHHIVMTHSDNPPSGRIYCDGVDVSGAFTNRAHTGSVGQLQIARNTGGYVDGAPKFVGAIAELALYLRMLTAEEVLKHYRDGTTRRGEQ